MIVAFYDENFRGSLNNASLKGDVKNYKLIKRPIELNEISCTCLAFTEDMQPTFMIIEDEDGNYVYGSLAGVPVLNENNQTEITGTDLKKILKSKIFIDTTTIQTENADTVRHSVEFLFDTWNSQHDNKFTSELQFVGSFDPEPNFDPDEITDLKLTDYKSGIYNALEEIQKFMRFYDLYMDTKIDVVNQKVIFMVGRTMVNQINLNLRDIGVKNYGKIVADINESQGYVVKTENDVETWYRDSYEEVSSIRWILTSNNEITTDATKRDIYPVNRELVSSSEDMYEANKLALEALLDLKYNEDIDLDAEVIKADLKRFASRELPLFSARFDVYTESGVDAGFYKSLPCGELEYNANNELVRFKTGYRYTSVNFI